MRYKDDFLYVPDFSNEILKINYIPVLSRQKENWDGEKRLCPICSVEPKNRIKKCTGICMWII